ncbi:DUF4962 domain-containing protein [Paenibacillus dokdonensis]|uniref:DUF4962 domain-containing protein n=1 Tax=Paenibacillus dokdonensis TaxID=2567944 RepID=A0ABU6GQW6_9BACL|nr:DUF4962 domain-containing protein [Paenibacillus dokdonensis]MEC0242120.1 DUF4962 domain-containing protein [Paenibacillus dokdonensis]
MSITNALYQPLSGDLTVQYQPSEEIRLSENPPRFTWIPAKLEDDCYTLEVSPSPDFDQGETKAYGPLHYNFFTPDEALLPGIYYWRYALVEGSGGDVSQSEWSRVRRFEVPEGLPETPLACRSNRYGEVLSGHPRLWLQPDELGAFRGRVEQDASDMGWQDFYELSVKPWLSRKLIPEPAPYPNNKRTAALWRQSYLDCQEMLYAIRHLSIAAIVLKDMELINQAKRWLLHASSWDANGTTSRDYNDESAFRIAGALAWGYDWLYDELTADERELIREKLLHRTRQVAFHVIERSKIHQVPYDSHAVRSLSSVLVPCCIALFDEEPEARDWLDYTVEYYYTLFSPWGGEDGGWAEGPHYWTTGMAYLTEAMDLLKNFAHLNVFQRPFFQHTGDFPLYCYSPTTSTRTTFGDNSTLGDDIIKKVGYNIRQYAGITGNGWYQWYFEQLKDRNPEADLMFYNYGWWDFHFDELLYRHNYPVISEVEPSGIEPVKWFRDVGWVAMHHKMHEPGEQISLVTKCSRYGSVSHSHGDQGAFMLHAFGEPLAIESGYYIAFNSSMHLNWRRQTCSKNTILIDGQGQFADMNKALNIAAKGEVEDAFQSKDYAYVRMNPTQAYLEHVPYLKQYKREIYFVQNAYFVIVDSVDLEQPGRIQWLFHTLYEMELKGQSFHVHGRQADMEGRFIFSSAGDLVLTQSDEFTGVDPAEIEGLAKHWHLSAETQAAASHRIATLLVPKHHSERGKYVSYFMDDQGFSFNLYLTDNGRTQKIEIAKAF